MELSRDGKTLYVGHGWALTNDDILHCGSFISLDSFRKEKVIKVDYPVSSLAVSPAEDLLAAGLRSGETVVLDSSSAKIIKRMPGTISVVNALAWSPDGRYLFAGGEDGIIKIWNYETEETVDLVVMNNSEWFVYNDGGRFDCSPNGRDLVKFSRGLEVYEPDQFWTSIYTPGLLARFFGREELEKINLAAASESLPELAVLSPEQNSEYTDEGQEITVQVRATDTGGGVGPVFLYHNGRVVGQNTRGLSVKISDDVHEFTLRLAPGNNLIQAAAYNRDNTAEGRSEAVQVLYSPPVEIIPDLHILSFGVSNYRDSGITLNSPVDDAKEIAAVFNDVAQDVYATVNTVVMTDEEVRAKTIIKELASLSANVTVDDTVLIFFAGHGYTDNGVYYYFPYEGRYYRF